MGNSFKDVFTEMTHWPVDLSLNTLSLSSDGTILAGTTAAGDLRFWDTKTGDVTSPAPGNWSFVVFSPTDPNMAIVIGTGGNRVIQRGPGQPWNIRAVEGDGGFVIAHSRAAFSPDGKMAIMTWTGSSLYEVRPPQFHTSFPFPSTSGSKASVVAYFPTEPTTLAIGYENGEISIALRENTTNMLCKLSQAHVGSKEISAIAWSPNGKWLATGDKAGDVRLWRVIETSDVQLKEQLPSPDQSGTVNALIFLPDSTALLISRGSQLHVWDVASGNSVTGGHYVTDSGLPSTVENIAWDRGQNRLAVATDDKITLYGFKPKGNIPQNVSSLPSRLAASDITASLIKSKEDPFPGIYLDVYRGGWKLEKPCVFQHAVVIKVLRTSFNPQCKARERKDFENLLNEHITTWLDLSHNNLVPLLGVSTGFGKFPAMVMSWMMNGLLSKYLDDNEVDLGGKLGFTIDVANGVEYLHSQEIVHGDIRASSILVDEVGNARLADPGLLPILAKSPLVTDKNVAPRYRWMAPELVNDSSAETTKATDVYSVMMTSLEIFTGAPPFKGISDAFVPAKIQDGKRPDKPADVGNELWSMWVDGWDEDAGKRPAMARYAFRLNQLRNA